MAKITVTEARAELKTIGKRVQKKKQVVMAHLVRLDRKRSSAATVSARGISGSGLHWEAPFVFGRTVDATVRRRPPSPPTPAAVPLRGRPSFYPGAC